MTFANDIFWIVVSFLLTTMVLSYLLGDNVFFRIAANIFIGLTAAYVILLIFSEIFWPYLITPLINGTWSDRLWLLIPIILIGMLLLSQFRRFAWIGSLPMAYLLGLASAIAIGGAVFGVIVPQSLAIIDLFDANRWFTVPQQTWLRIIDAIIMLIGTIGTLSYFHFGRKLKPKLDEDHQKRPAPIEILSKIGEVFIGITLGAIFVNVFSSALLALIDRIQFIGQFVVNLIGSF